MALEAQQSEIERAQMQSEDFQSKLAQRMELEEKKTAQLTEEISYIQCQLYNTERTESMENWYNAACDALEILDPGHPENYPRG